MAGSKSHFNYYALIIKLLNNKFRCKQIWRKHFSRFSFITISKVLGSNSNSNSFTNMIQMAKLDITLKWHLYSSSLNALKRISRKMISNKIYWFAQYLCVCMCVRSLQDVGKVVSSAVLLSVMWRRKLKLTFRDGNSKPIKEKTVFLLKK